MLINFKNFKIHEIHEIHEIFIIIIFVIVLYKLQLKILINKFIKIILIKL